MRYLAIAFLLVTTPVIAQQQDLVAVQPQTSQSVAISGDVPLEITTSLLVSEEGKAALAEFQNLKDSGLMASGTRSTQTLEVGATVLFWVRNVSTNAFVQRDFTLQHDATNFRIWAETAEITNGNVRVEDVEAVRAAMADATPVDSYNPAQGIIDNDEEIFGAPPNFDGDGKTDLLLVDVHDDYDPNTNPLFVAGFFDPNDLTNGAQSNNADVIYMDTMPGMVSSTGTRRPIEGLLQTTAHEYQHLIHSNFDSNEDIWVNEAQSEWAEIELGYPGRAISYLLDASEHDIEMFAFRSGTFEELLDRERGALVSKFFAEQLGTLVQGSVTRETSNSEDGYIDAFGSDQAFFDVVLDYHTAVLFNDQSFSPRFGFSDTRFDDIVTPVDISRDGRTVASTSARDSVVSGGVVYLRWEFVENFNYKFNVEGPLPFLEAYRDRVPTRLIFENDSGIESFTDIRGDDVNHVFPGVFRSVTAIVGQVKPGASGAAFTYDASWLGGSTSMVEDIAYDGGSNTGDYFSFDFDGMATRFVVPMGAQVSLDNIQLANYYLSNFDENGEATARAFTVKVWEVENNAISTELFSLQVDDPRPWSQIFNMVYDFASIDLSTYASELSSLPDTIAVGVTDAGDNSFVSASFAYPAENISWIQLGADWSELWNITLSDGGGNEVFDFTGSAFPFRASFLVEAGPVAVEGGDVLPGSISLGQNYPNPFNPQTSIDFALPSAGNVDLAVFDLLGRRVATLATGITPAGTHRVQFDGSQFASGVYVYRLESNSISVTKTMLLLK